MPQSSQSLSHLIADKVVRHVLPSDRPLKLWTRRGDGRPCNGCEKPITTMEIEHALGLSGDLILRLHIACEDFWRSATGNEVPGPQLPSPRRVAGEKRDGLPI